MYAKGFFHCRIMVAFAYLMPVVLCTILRLPCMTIADFTITEHGKRLTGSVISRHYDTTDVQCMILCIQNGKCRSYNMQRTKLICELNGNSLADNGAKLSDDIEWLYRSTNYSSPLVCSFFAFLASEPRGIECIFSKEYTDHSMKLYLQYHACAFWIFSGFLIYVLKFVLIRYILPYFSSLNFM